MPNKSFHTLYLCYFGLREALVQTQVLPYLREIKKGGVDVSILTFEPNPKQNWTLEQIEAEKKKLAEEGIDWHFLEYHKRPSLPATFYDVIAGARFARRLSKKTNVDVLHARAHIPVLMGIFAKRLIPAKLIFDIRGLVAEEYADGGVWKENSIPFRALKYVEKLGIEKASQVVVLTERMRNYLVEKNLKQTSEIEIIPCCVDFSRVGGFSEEKNGRFELIYAGSATGLYLIREMGLFFLNLKKYKPDAFFRVLTSTPSKHVADTFSSIGIQPEDFDVQKVAPSKVPFYLKKAHLGISFRKPTFSQIAASPTKIPEYLSCGLPVVSNYGIGDTDKILESENVGFCVKSFESEEYEKVVQKLLGLMADDNIEERCREVSKRYFDLVDIGKKRYLNVYERIQREVV
jgi:glycosyltransferase involved in cell wall biosynthesis